MSLLSEEVKNEIRQIVREEIDEVIKEEVEKDLSTLRDDMNRIISSQVKKHIRAFGIFLTNKFREEKPDA